MTEHIKWLEENYPLMTAEFKQIQKEQYKLFCKKQRDYGPGNIAVGTPVRTKEDILLSLIGLWFRMNDKLQRLKQLVVLNREPAVKNEPIEDSYLDISNYGIMAEVVRRKKWGE